ncbi:hypothetical protein [Priestia aryabhattai]|uniref:hypothetical protein n=1 Tax=Priestia aryabhattai TaxID=412384 RepID=UPI001C8E5C10|nr:hypothetical protein [Priestia aryabhattai]MBX9997325.1 hypothetical protein [Priestia aryabhattai]
MREYSAEVAREEMRKQGRVKLNLHFDASRYIIASVRFMDLVYSFPFLLITAIALLILYKTGTLSTTTLVIAFVPFVFSIALLSMKDADRKNINQWNKIFNKINFVRRERTFHFTKEVNIDLSQDIRTQLGIFNISNGCYETLDNRLVKVLKVSSVNITLMSPSDRERVFESYKNYLNDIPREFFDIQTNEIVQPVDLKNYLTEIDQAINNERDYIKRMLNQSYRDKVYKIQKQKNMVSRERYVILSTKNDKKGLAEIDRMAESLKTQIQNMLRGRYKLDVKILDNAGLEDLIYLAVDYENAQTNRDMDSELSSFLTVSNKEYSKMKTDWKEKEQYTIY